MARREARRPVTRTPMQSGASSICSRLFIERGGFCGSGCESGCESGASLVMTLLMLVVTMLLGVSAARITSQGEKASRSDRDRQIAFQAAEEALRDAELDIEGGVAGSVRSAIFSPASIEGFTEGCTADGQNPYLGLCLPDPDGGPAWKKIDFFDTGATSARSVPYGRFTGRAFPAWIPATPAAPDTAPSADVQRTSTTPARVPRYIIEALAFNKPGEAADLPGKTGFYLITAVGFGTRESTQVVLQSLYRKEP